MKLLLAICALLFANHIVINGVEYECKDGICAPVGGVGLDEEVAASAGQQVLGESFPSPPLNLLPSHDAGAPGVPQKPLSAPQPLDQAHQAVTSSPSIRMKEGYMGVMEFISFLNSKNSKDPIDPKDPNSKSLIWAVLLAILGGVALNLTPCVLPMIPVNLIIIGKSFRRGLLYGLGITLAYGALGLACAIGGVAFGQIQSSPWFNFGVAAVFVFLSLSLFDVYFIDLSKFRMKTSSAFLMGALAAVLAGACVAPVLITVLTLTAAKFAAGETLALCLPFALGLGMGLPWPLLGAGLQVLPKPGSWMRYVNKAFGLLVLCFAAYYAYLGVRSLVSENHGVRREGPPGIPGRAPEGAPDLSEQTVQTFLLPDTTKPILVDCWASWCKNCAAMERTTLQNPEVQAALKDFTVIRLQAEDLTELKKLQGFEQIRGLPAFVIFEKD